MPVRKSLSTPNFNPPTSTQLTSQPQNTSSGEPSSSRLRVPPLRSMTSSSFLGIPTKRAPSRSTSTDNMEANPGTDTAGTNKKKSLKSRISIKNLRKLVGLDKTSKKSAPPMPTPPALSIMSSLEVLLQRRPDKVDTNEKRTVHSFGGPPPQEIKLLKIGEQADDVEIFRRLSDDEVGQNGNLMINVGAMRFNSENGKLTSHSFTGCTPIIAFYGDNKTGMYHANSASKSDEHVNQLIEERPTDIFIVARQGAHKSYSARQAANAANIVNRNPDCRVHILELPEVSELSVSIEPGAISVIQGRPPYPG
jgi:hypothetical protein